MNNILSSINSEKEFVIYGAGALANVLYLYLRKKGLDRVIRCFVVTETNSNQKVLHDKRVVDAESYFTNNAESHVYICVQKIVQGQIIEILEKYGVNNYTTIDTNELLTAFYSELYTQPISNNKIVFMNMKGLGYGDNPKYIAESILKKDKEKNLDLVWVVDKEGYSFPQGIRTVLLNSYEYYKELATSKIWIDNTRKTSDVCKRRGQYYIQTWHGAAPGKKVELDAKDYLSSTYLENGKRDSEMADLFISGSEFYSEVYRRAFEYRGEILESGLPRQDIFFRDNDNQNKIKAYYSLNKECGIVLFAPTFRNDCSVDVYNINFDKVRRALKERFKRDFIVFVSRHPDLRNRIEYKKESQEGVIYVADYDDFQEILMASDVLITDYSGCMYDYSFLKRPIFLYQFDYDNYHVNDRTFYIPFSELPYPIANNIEDLIYKIKHFNDNDFKYKLERYMKRFGNFDDGNAADRVANKVFDIIVT